MALDPFPITVQEKEGQFLCFVQGLSIVETSNTLLGAYENARQKKELVLNQLQTVHLMASPHSRFPSRTVNLFIISLALLVPLMTALYPISHLIQKCFYFVTLRPSELIAKASHRLEKMPSQDRIELQQALESFAYQLNDLISAETTQGNN